MTDRSAGLLARLAGHRLLGGAPAEEHRWLAANGRLHAAAAGDVITRRGEQAEDLLVLFEGHLVIRADRGAGALKIFEWRGGDCGGCMPYSRGASPPGDVVAEAPSTMLLVPREALPAMVRECPQATTVLVHAMLDRARAFTLADFRDDKLVSLGRLAAGLAHELGNPASAAVRGAKMLAESVEASEASARRLAAAHLTDTQLAAMDTLRAQCLKPAPTGTRSTLGRSDREDELAEWLAAHGADERCAGPLAETGATFAALDDLAALVAPEVLDAALKSLAAGCSVRLLASEIDTAASRIHDLVSAVKGFTHMDHARAVEAVDIRPGIRDTLTVLGGKLRGRAVDVVLEFAADLPRVPAVAAELNQVWMNLIDNAVDAAPANSRVTVSADHEMKRVVVRIVDEGPGIPPAILGSIFDPFFTTKPVGEGTGLGLDIVRRLVRQADGEVTVSSEPGHTEFQVRLPVAAEGHVPGAAAAP